MHTYSKDLRDKYIKNNYVVVYTMGTGKAGGTKVRAFPKSSLALSVLDRTGIVDDGMKWHERQRAITEAMELIIK